MGSWFPLSCWYIISPALHKWIFLLTSELQFHKSALERSAETLRVATPHKLQTSSIHCTAHPSSTSASGPGHLTSCSAGSSQFNFWSHPYHWDPLQNLTALTVISQHPSLVSCRSVCRPYRGNIGQGQLKQLSLCLRQGGERQENELQNAHTQGRVHTYAYVCIEICIYMYTTAYSQVYKYGMYI